VNNKEFLLQVLDEARLRELAEKWRVSVEDARLRAPGIAKRLARKRAISVAEIVEALTDDEAAAAVRRLEVPIAPTGPRPTLLHHLTDTSWRAVRRTHADFTVTSDMLRAEVVEVVDGDTLRVLIDGKPELVRMRGVDAPESRPSDKVERDLDRAGPEHDHEREYALGTQAAAWLGDRIGPGTIVTLHVERRANGSLVKLRGFRLLAFVELASAKPADIGLSMIESGHALVWPRGTKSRRYQHPRIDAYLRACNAAFHSRPGLWNDGLSHHCPVVQAGGTSCSLADCERTCSPAHGAPEESEA
jgi:endonuclease YncB( thermonuclease family)